MFKHLIHIICVLLLCSLRIIAQPSSGNEAINELYTQTKLDYNSETALITQILESNAHSDTLLKYADKLINLSLEDDELNLKGYYYKGLAFKQKGLYGQSLDAFYTSANIAKRIECNSCLIAAKVAIGDVFSDSHNSKNAILYYNKALALARHEIDSIFLASTLMNAGAEYLILEEHDSAIVYLNQAKNIFNLHKNEYGYAYCLGKIGKVQFNMGNLVLAEQNISTALSLLESYQDNEVLSTYYLYLSEINQEKGDLKSALEFAHISLSIAEYSNLLPQVRDSYQILTELYTITGNVENAFKCQSNYINTRDKINNEETIRRMADLRTAYEVAQKQTEVDLLNRKRQNQQLIVIGLLIFLLLTGMLFLVLYTNTRKRKTLHNKLLLRQEELQKQKDELEKLNRTKDRFFSIISHDLRGPINVLNGTTLLIRDFLNSKSYDELDELTANMEYSVKKVQNLLDNLLEWAVSQQGEFPYKPEELDMDEICDNVLNIFIAMAATKSIHLTYEIKPGSRFLVADKNSLMTIIRNLVSNALKFTHKDGAVAIIAESKNNIYTISVSDNGVGISPEKKENLFKIAESKSTWGTAKEKGLGIGLSLVSEFVKMNKGEITVDSQPGVGTSISFTIPQNNYGERNIGTTSKIVEHKNSIE